MHYSKNQCVDFKQEYSPNIVKNVIAFANTEGGVLSIGIDKDGTACGVDDPEHIIQQLKNALRDDVAPDILSFVSFQVTDVDEQSLLEVTVSTGTERPYFIRDIGLLPDGVYIRNNGNSQSMTEQEIRKMIHQVGGSSYEEWRSLEQNLTFTTLKEQLSHQCMELDTPLMYELHLIGADHLYTNLAYLLSDQCPSMNTAVLFHGRKDLIYDQTTFSGSLLKQLEDLYFYLEHHSNIGTTHSTQEHADRMDYPSESIREMLVNAVCHRDYSDTTPNLIGIYEDHIEVTSRGGLLEGFSLESIFLGISIHRNPHLAQLLYRMHLIESYGSGIARIRQNYKHLQRKPVFESDLNLFRVTLPNINYTTSKMYQSTAN